MERIRNIIIIVFLLLFYAPVIGQATDSLSLNDYLEIAAENNPELKSTFIQYLAALEKVPQVGALPDPQATFGFFIQPMAIVAGSQVGNIQLMQMFPWFGTLNVAKDEASEMANGKYEVFVALKADLFYRVKVNWWNLMKIDREIILVRENIELLESLEKLVMIKFQSPSTGGSSSQTSGNSPMNSPSATSANTSGNGMSAMQGATSPSSGGNTAMESSSGNMNSAPTGLQDVLRVKMEILDQKNKLALLTDQRRTSTTSFNALLNRDLTTRIQISDSLMVQTINTDQLAIADSILSNNPMLAMLDNEVASYHLMEQKAKKMGLPMLGVGLNYMINQKRAGSISDMNGKDMLMPMFTVTIPIYRAKYNAMQNEARYMQESGNEQINELKNDLMVQYQTFLQNLDDAKRRIDLYQEQEDLARKTTDLLLSDFSTTGANYEEVLRMQYKVLDYGFKHVEALTDYNSALALAEKLMNSFKN
jgi:outer membrane protein TolC